MADNPSAEKRGLLIVAHGSSVSKTASQSVYAHADTLRQLEPDRPVGVAFLREEPSIEAALSELAGASVVVVPFFMGDGYFVDVVRRRAEACASASRSIVVSAPFGLFEPAIDLAEELARAAGLDASKQLVLVGHGTTRSTRSSQATKQAAARLRQTIGDEVASVVAAFIDESPTLDDVVRDGRSAILVPWFAANGPHVTEDIGDWARQHGSVVTGAVGAHPACAEMVLRIARHAIGG